MSTGPDRALQILKTATFLGGLPEPLLAELGRRAHLVRFRKGQTIFMRGDAGDSLLIVLEGRVKIANITADAREVVLNFLAKGDVIGEIAVLDGRERTASAIALEATEALQLYRRDVLPVLTGNPEAMIEIIAVLCDKLRAASAIVEDNTLPMTSRAALGLLRLAEQHGRKTRDGVLIDLKLSQRDLGSYLGLSRENANRQLGLFRDRGLVRLDGGGLLILDSEGLKSLADAAAIED